MRFDYFQSVTPNLGHTALFGRGGGGCWNKPWGIFDGFDFCLHSILHLFVIGDTSQYLSKGKLR